MVDEGRLSGTQRFIRRLSSGDLFAAMERDSRLWKAECPHCRAGISVWEMGGIRYKAAGAPRRRMRCRACGEKGWHRIHWTGGDVTALGLRPSVLPLVFKAALIFIVLPLLLVGAVAAILVATLA